MSRTFETDADVMTTMGKKVATNAGQIHSEIVSLIGRLEGVDWKGSAATSFHLVKADWQTRANNIKNQLEDVAETLGVNATTYNQVHEASQTGYEHLRGQNLSI